MHILGINAYHGGSSSCLIRDGQLVSAVEEERLNRVKYWAGFPSLAIAHCLEEGGIGPQELDHVAISRDPKANFFRKALFAVMSGARVGYLTNRIANLKRVASLEEHFSKAVGVKPGSLRATFHHVEHHRAHLASAFFVSPFDDAALLSVDGMGDFSSTMWGAGYGNKIEVSGAIRFPHSLGYLYTMVSQWLGFPHYGDEGKVMGLAPYGRPNFLETMREIVPIQRDGTFILNLKFFRHESEEIEMTWDGGTPVIGRMYGKRLIDRFGPPRRSDEPITEHHKNVAASLQARLEEAVFALLHNIHKETGSANLCLAGGVAMNSVMNGKILDATPFEHCYIQPAAGDSGTALGAAYWVYHQVLGKSRTFVMDSPFTGPAFRNGSVERVLLDRNLTYQNLDEDALCRRVAELIAEGKIIGWFQGRMEWGARALGARSIVADPRRSEMKDILNARIKRREPFRPFAPSILEEAALEYFALPAADPFMLTVRPVREDKRSVIPAVTHVDGTGRLQTVNRKTAPRFWKLIKAFEDLTGVPVVLNTSFNENEPVVCRPEEAVDCFQRTRMDALAIENMLIVKAP